MNSTVIAATMIRNVSFQDVLKIRNFVITCLTSIVALIASTVVFTTLCHAQLHPSLTKESIMVHQRLQAPWKQQFDNTLAESSLAISNAYGVTLWIDPSLPRDKQITVDRNSETLADMLDELVAAIDGSVIPIEGVILIVPEKKADAIWAQYWRNRTSPKGAAWSKVEASSFAWDTGTSVKDLADKLSSKWKLPSEWIDALPHDLWPAFSFPKQSSLAIITCVLSGLELQVDLTKNPIVIEPLVASRDADTRVDWEYPREMIKRLGAEHCKAWKAKHPTVEIKEEAARWKILAKPSQHLSLVRPLIPTVKYQVPSIENSRFQGEMQGTLGNIVQSIAKQTELEFHPWPLPEAVSKREVKVKSNNATIDELLKELGDKGGVQFQRQGMKCQIDVLNP